MKIVDGNCACSSVAYLFSEICSIYPITPSSVMAENIDDLKTNNVKNFFGSSVKVQQMQSEAGAAGAMHGALLTGALCSTFTSSQGLLLMIPNMYKMAGEKLPGVIHVAARSLATHSLSIFGDHQDIYSARSTGFCMLSSSNVYDAQNMAAVAHLSAIEGSLPFLHFFDGFRTSHEINTIKNLPLDELKKLVNYKKIEEFKNRVLYVNAKKQYGLSENEDIYFQSAEARNIDYDNMPDIVNKYMESINKIMDMDYKPFNYYGASDAECVIIAMGSVCDTLKLVVDSLNKIGQKCGFVNVHLYRPFSQKYLLNVLPSSVKKVAVLDKTKEAGSIGEPLYLDVLSALKDKNISIVGGRYGLSSKNVTPSDICGVFKMLNGSLKNNFTIGIEDDLTHLSIKPVSINIKNDFVGIKVYGFGSDGMVSASKDLLKIINKISGKYVQGYFEYDSKKSGGVTVSNLRISDNPINMPFYVEKPNITIVTKVGYINKFNLLNDVSDNGKILINTNLSDKKVNEMIFKETKKHLIEKNIEVFKIDADEIAFSNGLNGKISKIIENIMLYMLGMESAKDILIENIKIQFKTKGESVIQNNINALEKSVSQLKKVELDDKSGYSFSDDYNLYEKIQNRQGNSLTVKDCLSISDGGFISGTTKYEKRNTALKVPMWTSEKCIECGQCSLVCPHAAIRTFLTKNEGKPLLESKEFKYLVEISNADCTGCGVCVKTCPVKALEMTDNYFNSAPHFDNYENEHILNKYTVKGSQLEKPLFEFSGACAGCGETSYIKLLTQLVGRKLILANATGCSSIYGGSVPSTPYHVPWANSLFEDNAEFALGMHISLQEKRNRIECIMTDNLDAVSLELKSLFASWLNNKNDYEKTLFVQNQLSKYEQLPDGLKDLLKYIPAFSVWAIGGDGWAYDIGYGGIDHLLHSNENVKILVLDTEVYSNTGGQSSKATSLGAVASFANMGKRTPKKDLFNIAMNIPNCYVASISLGANMFQAIKAFKEAEEHNGPSIVIAYSPCIEHGIKSGMSCSSLEQKLAVECGYTILMRYKPDEEKLYIDSKEPDFEKYFDFLNNEVRYNSLLIKDEIFAKEILNEQKEYAKKRYAKYKEMVK